MSEFDKRLKSAAERFEETPEGADSPDCSAELDRRVKELLTRPDMTGKERIPMKHNNPGRMRPKWAALIAAAAVLVVMTVVVAASPVIRDFLHTRMLTEDGPERLTEVPEGWIGVYTVGDLDAVRDGLDRKYILMEDLVFDPADFEAGGRFEGGWLPIGTEDTPFTGIFNGNGHVIRGLTVNAENDSPVLKTENFVGLFGYCRLTPAWGDSEGQKTVLTGYIKNLGLEDGSVRAVYGEDSTGDRLFVGAVAGYSDYVIGCYVKNFDVKAEVTGNMDGDELKVFWSGLAVYNVTDYALAIGGVAGSAYLIDSCWTDARVTVDAEPVNVAYSYVSGVCGLTSACITSYFNGSIDAPGFEDRGICSIRENDVPRYLTNAVFNEIGDRLENHLEGDLFIPSLDATEKTGRWYRNMFQSFYCFKEAGIDQPFREAARDLIAADMDDMDVWILDPDLKPREYAELSELIAAAFPDGSFMDYCRENGIKYGTFYAYDMRENGAFDPEAFGGAYWTRDEAGQPVLGIFG